MTLIRMYWLSFIVVISCMLLATSCERRDEAVVQQVIQARVASNLGQFKARQLERCYREAMDAAILLADSLVLAAALSSKDTSHLVRPIKPTKPSIDIPKENVPVAPIFKKQ